MHPFLALPLLFATHTPMVTIELPPGTPEPLIERVVDSCNQALGGPRCRAAPAPDEPDALYALVSWEGVELAISLRRGTASGVEVDSRHVAFSDSDDPEDRYIAAGLMVAALTAAQVSEPPPAAAAPPEPPPVPVAPPLAPPLPAPEVTPVQIPLHLGLDLGAEVGQGLRGQGPKWGGSLRLWWLAHAPRIGASASASLLGAEDGVTVRWTTLAFGIATRVTPWDSRLGLDVFCDATAQHTKASATAGAEADSDAIWRFGARVGALVSVDTGYWIQPTLGVTLTWLNRGLEVTLAEDAQGSESLATLSGSLGVRLAPF